VWGARAAGPRAPRPPRGRGRRPRPPAAPPRRTPPPAGGGGGQGRPPPPPRGAPPPGPPFPGRVAHDGGAYLVDRDTALDLVPTLHERIRVERSGEVDRSAAAWRGWLAEVDAAAAEDRGVFHAIHRDRDGEPDGYAVYRIGEDAWPGGIPRMRLDVARLDATGQAADHALWTYLLGIDLIETVRVGERPIDDPVRWRLADPRRLRVRTLTDGLWLRLLDVPAMLTARRYTTAGTVVVEVADPLRAELGGCFRLEVGPDGAACEPVDADPDVALDAAALASAYLGGVRVRALAAAGRMREGRPGAIDLLDRLLATAVTPFCGTDF
jgi:predicted acetyltransferase